MKTMLRVLLIVLSVAASATVMAQDELVWITVFIGGKAVMGFVPAPEASTQSERGVCSEVQEAGAKIKDGTPIRAFEFTGWRENGGYQIRVFAVVPAQGEPGSRGLCTKGRGFKRLDFATLRARSGDEIVIERMKDAGVAPWEIRVGRNYPVSR